MVFPRALLINTRRVSNAKPVSIRIVKEENKHVRNAKPEHTPPKVDPVIAINVVLEHTPPKVDPVIAINVVLVQSAYLLVPLVLTPAPNVLKVCTWMWLDLRFAFDVR